MQDVSRHSFKEFLEIFGIAEPPAEAPTLSPKECHRAADTSAPGGVRAFSLPG